MSSDEYKVNWVYWGQSEESVDLEKMSKMLYEASPIPVKGLIKAYQLKENIKSEGKELIKKTPIYKMGHCDGRKEQATETSKKYEEKLKKQAQYFENQKVLLKKDIDDLKDLIKEYEEYIKEKQAEFEHLSKEQLKKLEEIKRKYEILLKIKY